MRAGCGAAEVGVDLRAESGDRLADDAGGAGEGVGALGPRAACGPARRRRARPASSGRRWPGACTRGGRPRRRRRARWLSRKWTSTGEGIAVDDVEAPPPSDRPRDHRLHVVPRERVVRVGRGRGRRGRAGSGRCPVSSRAPSIAPSLIQPAQRSRQAIGGLGGQVEVVAQLAGPAVAVDEGGHRDVVEQLVQDGRRPRGGPAPPRPPWPGTPAGCCGRSAPASAGSGGSDSIAVMVPSASSSHA